MDSNRSAPRDFRDILIKLPKHFTKSAAFKGKTLGEIAAMEPGSPRMGPGTLQKYFGCVRGFLQWVEDDAADPLSIGTA